MSKFFPPLYRSKVVLASGDKREPRHDIPQQCKYLWTSNFSSSISSNAFISIKTSMSFLQCGFPSPATRQLARSGLRFSERTAHRTLAPNLRPFPPRQWRLYSEQTGQENLPDVLFSILTPYRSYTPPITSPNLPSPPDYNPLRPIHSLHVLWLSPRNSTRNRRFPSPSKCTYRP